MGQGMEMEGMGFFSPLGFILYAVIIVVPVWKITTKAGYSGWLSLLMIVPLVNLIYLYFLGFSKCPSQQPAAHSHTGETPP